MKNFTFYFLLVVTSFFVSSYKSGPELNDIISALKSGNAGQLAKYFDSRVDISLPGKSDNYSRTQAEMIIKNFFETNPVRSFQVQFTGDNPDGSQYCTGTLKTKNGNFRTTLFMKHKGDKQFLQQISFQAE